MSTIPPPTIPPSTPPPGGGSYTPPRPPPGGAPAGAGGDRTIMLILSYAWFLSVIPLLVKKEDREIQWHAKNGLVMAIAYSAFGIIFWMVLRLLPVVACFTFFVPCIVFLAYVVVQIVCIIKAINGQRFRVPMLTDFAEKM